MEIRPHLVQTPGHQAGKAPGLDEGIATPKQAWNKTSENPNENEEEDAAQNRGDASNHQTKEISSAHSQSGR